MRCVGNSGGDSVPHEVAGSVVRLNHELSVIRIRRISPPRTLDVDLPIRVSRIVAPREQAEHGLEVQVVHDGIDLETIAAVAKGPRRNNLGALPLIRPVCDAQVQAA